MPSVFLTTLFFINGVGLLSLIHPLLTYRSIQRHLPSYCIQNHSPNQASSEKTEEISIVLTSTFLIDMIEG